MWSARLFLFALLLVDWASDPCQGTCPLSAVWASTEAYSVSADYREEIRKELVSGAAPAALPALTTAPVRDDRLLVLTASAARADRADDLLYRYMTLLC
jgi:hypothetical protein